MVWLGVDLGNARVGLALSDPELTFAHPAGNIHVAGDYFFAIDEVLNVVEDEHVTHIIVGLPLQMDGTEGKSAKKARRWAVNLEKRLRSEREESQEPQIPQVVLVDEDCQRSALIVSCLRLRRLRPSIGQWWTSSRQW